MTGIPEYISTDRFFEQWRYEGETSLRSLEMMQKQVRPSSLSKNRRDPSMDPATNRLSERVARQFTSPESVVAVIDIQMSSRQRRTLALPTSETPCALQADIPALLMRVRDLVPGSDLLCFQPHTQAVYGPRIRIV